MVDASTHELNMELPGEIWTVLNRGCFEDVKFGHSILAVYGATIPLFLHAFVRSIKMI